jgi:hypothetical protein
MAPSPFSHWPWRVGVFTLLVIVTPLQRQLAGGAAGDLSDRFSPKGDDQLTLYQME